MPSKHTFTIRPIKQLILSYLDILDESVISVDPFAGFNSLAKITNDLNSQAPTTHHTEAMEFVSNHFKDDQIDVFLFDPPYSPRQISECYKGLGMKTYMELTQSSFYSKIKDAATPKIKKNGIVICCGWNSGGFGKKRGFELIEILLVPHGGAHNDTIVTVERKIN